MGALIYEDLEKRIEKLEAMQAIAAEGNRPASSERWPSGVTKVHPSTKRAEAKHAPPLTKHETIEWVKKIPPNKGFKKKAMAKRFFSDTLEGHAQAQRVCYWLKKEGILKFKNATFEYYRPVLGKGPSH